MKTRNISLLLSLALFVLLGGCAAGESSADEAVPEPDAPTAVSLSDAAGTMLDNAQSDLAEIQSYAQRNDCYLPFQEADDLVIYDYGPKTVGEYDVSTTLYTDATRAITAGQTGGVAVHTYTQSGSVRFKVYFMISFSSDGVHVSPMWNRNETWTNGDDAILSCSLPEDDYAQGGTCTSEWTYSVSSGNTSVDGQTAHMSCTTSGIVT